MPEHKDDPQESQSQKKPTVFALKFENWDSLTPAQKREWAAQLRNAIVDEIFDEDEEVSE